MGFELLFDPGGVAVGAGGVDHHHHFAVGAVVNDQVVADAAGFIQQHRVLGFAGANALQIAGHQPLEFVFDAWARERQHAHVGDVEHTAALPHGPVLGHQALELHRHLPAGKRHHAAAGFTAELKQGGVQHRGGPQICFSLP